MTDTGQIPGEGLPENAGMVEQPGVPAPDAYTYLEPSEHTSEDDDLLLMPASQGAWSDAPAVPAGPREQFTAQGHPVNGTHGSGVTDVNGVRIPAHTPVQVPVAAAHARRPLHRGPASTVGPSYGGPQTGGVVRSLADRGPAGPQSPMPARHAGPPTTAPEHVDVPADDASALPGPQLGEIPPQGVPAWGPPEPVATPEPAAVPEAVATPEAVAAPEPAAQPEAVATSEPVETPEAADAAEAVVEPAAVVEAEAPVAPEEHAAPAEQVAPAGLVAPDEPVTPAEPAVPVASAETVAPEPEPEPEPVAVAVVVPETPVEPAPEAVAETPVADVPVAEAPATDVPVGVPADAPAEEAAESAVPAEPTAEFEPVEDSVAEPVAPAPAAGTAAPMAEPEQAAELPQQPAPAAAEQVPAAPEAPQAPEAPEPVTLQQPGIQPDAAPEPEAAAPAPEPAPDPVAEPAPAAESVVEVAPAPDPVVEPAPAVEPVVETAPAPDPVAEPAPAAEPVVETAPAPDLVAAPPAGPQTLGDPESDGGPEIIETPETETFEAEAPEPVIPEALAPEAQAPAAEAQPTEAPAAQAPAPEVSPTEVQERAGEAPEEAPLAAATQDHRPDGAAAETAPEAEAAPPSLPAPGYDDAEREAVLRVMRERRDIRNGFRSDPIPHEVLLRVLEAAHTAPSVGHSQPWDFVVIRSAETRRSMHELAQRQREAYAKSLPKARAKQFKELKIEAILDTPVNIVVTADPTRGGRHTLGRHTQPQMAPYSSALAVENLWLAARAEGLGVGWVSFFDEREMVRALGLPEHLEVVAYLCVGYVDEFPEEPELMQAGWSKRRPLSWVVHEETYGRRALPGEEPHNLLQETIAGIRPLDAKALGEAWERQKRMTKPAGALGMLEIISAQLSGLSRLCPPPVPEPAAVAIFAGDHGVHAQGVTAWPQEVTAQMVANFLGGGAVCNAFAAQVGAEVCVVDVGVAAELPATPGLLPRKVRPGTADFTTGPALTREEVLAAIEVGIETARDLVAAGNKGLLTGEMGIANTTASAALICVYTGMDPAEVTGRGTGINDEMHARKVDVVRRALELHQPDPNDPIGVLAAVGGLEHAAMAGFLLGGASLRTPVILDGVSAGAAALVARAIAPEALAACIAGHRSAEPGHVAALNKLGLRPLVDLDLRLGEGTGALLALPIVQSAARAMHDVATFDSAGVTEK
ncbi:nicotinate-nucleotide--dimethylbenzimidazole phosphoribosyltransferase [Streptomyces sp. NPDC060030]|uniref:nicotinate-nucleotide--dimethylbenzimidazole phosphoribosyltransferase n=1 Tax=Streptomyces sp. NPDC060030 TaxID=3347042 RepID=UPI00368AC5B1